MFDQAQEEADYQLGCFGNESQAAFSLSQRTQEYPRQKAQADKLVAAGRFVVVQQYPVYCVHTDAHLGMAYVILSDHATREEADAVVAPFYAEEDCGSDLSYHVEPPLPRPAPPRVLDDNWDDCPF